ncbi:MAG: beta-ketoacyl-[acyl-carrier-protein] synthase family protein [Bacteroidia bacterium]
MSTRVWVAGIGVISAIGRNATENFDALRSGRSGIGPLHHLSTVHRDVFPCGEVNLSNMALAELSGLDPQFPRTVFLSMIAAQEAFASSGLPEDSLAAAAFVSANTIGGMDRTEYYMQNLLTGTDIPRLEDVKYHDGGAVTALVASSLGITQHIRTISTACSSSANAIMHAARMIKAGQVDLAIAGGADALCRFTLNGFNTLMILDAAPCKPFDEERKGLNLGEGAGYLVLVSDRLKDKVNTVYAELTGYCNANDAFHQTASSAEGTGSALAMEGAMKMAGLPPAAIGYINLHGTGTPNNDLSEGTAITRLFGEYTPAISSTKSFTGHTLGACGGIEAVYSTVAVQRGELFPSLRFSRAMKEFELVPVTAYDIQPELRHVMSNSFGFGGNCTSLIFSKAE